MNLRRCSLRRAACLLAALAGLGAMAAHADEDPAMVENHTQDCENHSIKVGSKHIAAGCSSGPDHYELSLPATNIACLPSTLTVTACADSSKPCGNKYAAASGKTATLATNAGTLGAGTATATVTFDATGVASTTLAYPSAANNAAATVTLSGEQVAATNPRQCCVGASCTAANSCAATFSSAGLIVSSSATGGGVTPATQLSGKTSGQYYLRAVQTSSTTKACEAAVSGARATTFTYACVDPSACTAGNWMTVGGTTFGSGGVGGTPTLTFDATSGAAPFTFMFKDAGKINFTASVQADNGARLSGGSGNFVTKPAGLCAYSSDLSPCAAGDETCPKTKKAGETFSLSVRAVAWESDTDTDLCSTTNTTTPNYKATGIGLDRTLVAPSGGSNGTLGVASLNIASSGWASVNQSISEVGVFKFTATAPAYLDGETVVWNGSSTFSTGNLGRFYPDHFDVTAADGALAAFCGGFTYTGQAMGYATAPSLTIKPMNALATPTVTTNYRDAFQKLAASGVTLTVPTADATQKGKDGSTKTVVSATLAAGALTNSSGTLTYTLAAADRYTYTGNANSLIAPYTAAIRLPVTAVTDSDGVAASGTPPTLAPTGVAVRYGRARLMNANGSELLALSVPFKIEYYSGTTQGWQKNTADTCTPIDNGKFAFAFPAGTASKPNNLAACETAMTLSGSAPNPTLTLAKPGAGSDGWADITLNLDAASGNACTAVGASSPAAGTVNAPWLQYDWKGAGPANPSARATFGVFRSGPVIHLHESY